MNKYYKIGDRTFELSILETQIIERIKFLSNTVEKDYEGKTPILIGILNGAYRFTADLSKYITIDLEISFIKCKSYESTTSVGSVALQLPFDKNFINGRDVIIVEDIVDTGLTIHCILEMLKDCAVASAKVATLLYKPTALKYPIDLDYVGFEVENKFLVGYGLDCDGLGRNLNHIYKLCNQV